MAKGNGNGTAIVKAESFAICKHADSIGELVADNCQGALSETDLDRVRIPSGGGLAWTVVTADGERPVPEIEGVVLHHRDGRAYWRDKFGEGERMPPTCKSEDGITGIGDPGGECAKCPQAAFGGGCKPQQLLFIIERENILPTVIQLSQMSIKPSRQFFQRLVRQMINRFGAVVAIGLEKAKSAAGIDYSRATFKLKARLSDEDTALMKRLGQSLAGAFKGVSIANGHGVQEDQPF